MLAIWINNILNVKLALKEPAKGRQKYKQKG